MTRVVHHRASPLNARSAIPGGLASALVALLLLGANASPVLADADPASDVLLAQSAFFPYQPAVASQLYTAVNTTLGAVARVWLPLKVAIIGSPEDLGGVPEFFGRPQAYAEFLAREISFNHPQPLLVVMPTGFGLADAGSAAALAGLLVDRRHSSYGLIRSAILALVALARAAGHPIAEPDVPSGSAVSPGAFPVALLFGVPTVLLILAGILTLGRGKPRDPQPPSARPPPA
jgi:hypothetical protein